MKTLLCATALAMLGATTDAAVIKLGSDVSKNGTGIGGGNANNAMNNFYRLQQQLEAGNYSLGAAPTFGGAERFSPAFADWSSGGLAGFSFAVLHYGTGSGGTGAGGGVAFYYLNGENSFVFPSPGLAPNGVGGLSSIDLFRSSNPTPVSDSGSTLALLALGLGFLALAGVRARTDRSGYPVAVS